MKKISLIIVYMLILMILTSCDNNHNRSNVSIYENNEFVFEGEYISSDESTLTITRIDEKFDIKIDIVRLTIIDDGIGEILSEDKIKFNATDAQGNPIYGVICWEKQDSIKLEFTNSTWDYLPNGTKLEFYRSENIKQGDYDIDESKYDDNIPYAGIRFGILDSTFVGYKNKTGVTLFEQSNQESLDAYYIKKLDDVRYYYGTNEVVIGVRNDEICLMTRNASDVVGHTSPQVRELINSLDAEVLFEILPAVIEVNNSNNSKYFFYWEIDNGYIGFVTIGGDNPSDCYGYVVNSFVIFENLDILNSVKENHKEIETDASAKVLKSGDYFTISGIVDYSDEPSDIGKEYCSIYGDINIEYLYMDIYDEESKWSSNVFYTKENDTALLQKYVGQRVTVSGLFDVECHGIPYITNIDILQ